MVIRMVRGRTARPDVASGAAPVAVRGVDLAAPRWDVAAEAVSGTWGTGIRRLPVDLPPDRDALGPVALMPGGRR
ncbi:hypothetical protein LY71_11043 [Geodermatophilus tzadiensis]|uniref:Uncharacterized protein n=1 Tax=Geodermatophilus tzadiensis TaxID=1137988 RepID=A0A2T0TR77_9ACTN|nr:hypothetical protein LY71_11043 [Geodermatophilus tzadiensis]